MNTQQLRELGTAIDQEVTRAFAKCEGFEWVAQALMLYDMGVFTAEQALRSMRANAELSNPVLPSAATFATHDGHGFLLEADVIGAIRQRRDPAKMDLLALPQRPILGSDYVRRPDPEPSRAESCALCLNCPHRLDAPPIPATGEKA